MNLTRIKSPKKLMSSTSIKRVTRLIRPEGTRRSAVAAVVLALAAVAGCSSASSQAPTPPISSQLRAALKQWSAFPASTAGRPLVVEAGAGASGPPGFPDGADQDAYSDGAISLSRPLPTGPATAAGFPLITASDAASVLTSGHGANPSPATRLTVTGVKLGTAVFGTDRGRKALPAWQFSFRGVTGTATVLAVADSARFWPAGLGQVSTHVSAVQPGRNGGALTLTAVGAKEGTGPCEASYSVRQQSSAASVAVYVVESDHGSATACSAAGFLVTVPVTLAAPLGNRVLVDALTFAPIPVTQSLVSSS
jgi:invasion protein IalB